MFPNQRCIELKSLKLYINSFRNVKIFHEHVINIILEDFVAACDPLSVDIEGDFPRARKYQDRREGQLSKGKSLTKACPGFGAVIGNCPPTSSLSVLSVSSTTRQAK